MLVSARGLVERTTRRWVFTRHLPREFGGGAMYVSPSAGLRYLFKSMRSVDPMLVSLAKEFVRPGAVVWDIGANVGLFSTAAAFLAGTEGRVVAVEPDAFLVQLLRRTSRAQRGSAPITVVPVALASEIATREFVLAQRSNATNYLEGYGTTQAGGVQDTITVLTVTADWLLTQQPAPNVVKIDVEGAEIEVLTGATELLEKVRPTLILETQATTSAAATDFLRARGYRLFDGQAAAGARHEIKQATWSTIAIP